MNLDLYCHECVSSIVEKCVNQPIFGLCYVLCYWDGEVVGGILLVCLSDMQPAISIIHGGPRISKLDWDHDALCARHS